MDQQRHTGFVIGYTTHSGKPPVWKVRVKDETSPQNGAKLTVASIRDNIALSKGLNVNFLIGSVDDTSGQPDLRAVDVQLQPVG
ncbi:MAG TPA: hypothetical protein VLA04_06290 [Verrucomicrobiae bacterium]|nr:hypothetical protein [Verrucomicrobiae bacterium]